MAAQSLLPQSYYVVEEHVCRTWPPTFLSNAKSRRQMRPTGQLVNKKGYDDGEIDLLGGIDSGGHCN
jgi:hypothetical protein